MFFLTVLLLSLIPSFGAARRDPRHVGRRIAEKIELGEREYHSPSKVSRNQPSKRAGTTIIPQTEKIKNFVVHGTKIPDVDFDIGESYAGLLPISSAPNASQLYFWFFPTTNPNGTEDLTIWLNGGPGCSSLEGFLQENGPFLWQYGTFKPVRNPWTWVNLTNMIWVEHPVGTGFSQGPSTETSHEQVAASFLGFLKNFQDTFNFKNKKIYISGESYAGMYVPYIADAMFNSNDTTHFNVQGTMIYDPSINSDPVMQEIQDVQ
jgi:carboxypeptidase D